jgi:histone H3/H4
MALPKHNIEKIIRDAGAERVGEDATEALANELERIGLEISRKAILNAKHAGRKTVKEEDINLAAED